MDEEKARLDEVKRDELLRRLCSYCEKPKCTYHCSAHCKRAYHQ